MSPVAKICEQLMGEVADLRALLDDAYDTLRAIRVGEVDAVLVQGPRGYQLFTLEGAYESYRVLIEEMNQGAVTLSADGSILYCNRRFADLLKMPGEKILGLFFGDVCHAYGTRSFCGPFRGGPDRRERRRNHSLRRRRECRATAIVAGSAAC